MAAKTLQAFSREEVAKHNTPDDLWIIIDGNVYDVTRFKDFHPGGTAALLQDDIPGQDVTETFYSLHRHEVLKRPAYKRLHIGTIEEEESVMTSGEIGELSEVPYAEPAWLTPAFHSPYYKESHRKLQRSMRKFVDELVKPEAWVHEGSGARVSPKVVNAMAQHNVIAMRMGPGPYLKNLTLMDGSVSPEEFDYFHGLIVHQELARQGQRGYGDGLLSGAFTGLPPVVHFGSPALKAKIIPEVLSGKKFVCLAVSEPSSGSDIASMRTQASKTADGQFWVINGTKKWTTNGTFADYFTVACQTDNGITLILVERGEGVETKPIETMYSASAGTALVTFYNVQVSVENTIGSENSGMTIILSNFNHERWVMCATTTVLQRLITEDVLKWVNQRKAFGRPLASLAVVRSKIAAMIARVETCQNWLENVTHQMNNMSFGDQDHNPIALLKTYTTKCTLDTAREAIQIFGGRGVTKTGMGQFMEQAYRAAMFDSVLGGAESMLSDFGMKQALKGMPSNVRL